MELDDIVYKYRNSKTKVRIAICIIAGLLPSLYYWGEEGQTVQEDLETAASQNSATQSKLTSNRRKVKRLPELKKKMAEIEADFARTREILPSTIQLGEILGSLSKLEKEFRVKVIKFEPGEESQPNPNIEVKERPVDLIIIGGYSNVIQFMDRVVHLPSLTHLRDVSIARSSGRNKKQSSNFVTAKVKLILFRSL